MGLSDHESRGIRERVHPSFSASLHASFRGLDSTAAVLTDYERKKEAEREPDSINQNETFWEGISPKRDFLAKGKAEA